MARLGGCATGTATAPAGRTRRTAPTAASHSPSCSSVRTAPNAYPSTGAVTAPRTARMAVTRRESSVTKPPVSQGSGPVRARARKTPDRHVSQSPGFVTGSRTALADRTRLPSTARPPAASSSSAVPTSGAWRRSSTVTGRTTAETEATSRAAVLSSLPVLLGMSSTVVWKTLWFTVPKAASSSEVLATRQVTGRVQVPAVPERGGGGVC